MANDGKTELQRDILLAWYNNPDATNKEISDICNCSPSYVSTVKNRFDNYNQFEAMMDRQDKQMEQMFGDGIFTAHAAPVNSSSGQPGVATMCDEIPNNPAGLVIKAMILIVLLYTAYHIAFALI